MTSRSERVVIVGIDGFSWKVFNSLADRGVIPNLKRMRSKGCAADFLSTYPPLTAPAWTSAFTGVNPGKHGIFDFVRVNRKYEKVPVSSRSRKVPAVWNIVNAFGGKVVVVNVPITYLSLIHI